MMTAAKLSIRGDWKSVEAQFYLVRGLALRSWRQFFASFAVKKSLTAKNAKDSQRTQSKSFGKARTELGALLGCAFWAAGLCDLCGKAEHNREEGQGVASEQRHARIH